VRACIHTQSQIHTLAIAVTFNMEHSGFNNSGEVMTCAQLEELRRKRGECVTCGTKCYNKKMFKKTPITDHGRVLNGRCLNCHPLDASETQGGIIPAVSRLATQEEQIRFSQSQGQGHSQTSLGIGLASISVSGQTPLRPARTHSASSSSQRSSQRTLNGAISNSGSNSNIIASNNSSSRTLSQNPLVSLSDRSLTSRLSNDREFVPPARLSSRDLQATALSGELMSRLSLQGTGNFSSMRHHDAPTSYQRPTAPPRNNSTSMYSDHSEQAQGSEKRTLSHASLRSNSFSMDSVTSSSQSHDDGSHRLTYGVGNAVEAQDRSVYFSMGVDQSQSSLIKQRLPQLMNTQDLYIPRDFPLAASAHPAAITLLALCQRPMDNSQRSSTPRGSSTGSSYVEVHNNANASATTANSSSNNTNTSDHGDEYSGYLQRSSQRRLDRGGQVDYRLHRTGGEASNGMTDNRGSHHREMSRHSNSANSGLRYATNSIRSLDSMSSFGADELTTSIRQVGPVEPRFHSPLEAQSVHSQVDINSSVHNSLQSLLCGRDASMGSIGSNTVDRIQTAQPVPTVLTEEMGINQLQAADLDVAKIIKVLRAYIDMPHVEMTGLKKLSSLELTQKDFDSIVCCGGLHLIVAAMQSYSTDMELQLHGCRAMCNTSKSLATQLGYMETGALDVLLYNMDHFPHSTHLHAHVMTVLVNLAKLEVNVEMIVEKGTVSRVIEVMNRYSEHEDIQQKGCAVISTLAAHPTRYRQTILDAGAGGAVVISMVMHPNEAALQGQALDALRNLTADCESSMYELVHLGAIESVISAMQTHRGEAQVQEGGAYTLANLAMSRENAAFIGANGGIDAVAHTLRVYSDELSVQESCLCALAALTEVKTNSLNFIETGGISEVVNVMQANIDSAVVQEMGCCILTNMAVDDQVKLRIVDEEALDGIVLAMVMHTDNVRVQRCACRVLLQLSIRENLRPIHASNFASLVEVAYKKFPDECGEAACQLLPILEQEAAKPAYICYMSCPNSCD
jgi:hypothetical protein